MNSGLYAACTGLAARMESLDTIASNLANSSSAGFRGEKHSFGSVLTEASSHGNLSALNKATNTYCELGDTELDTTQGVLTQTGNNLDAAIEGPGYFKVQTSTSVAYTRNGSFQRSTNGVLTTATGDAVLGTSGGPITLGTGAVTISSDGTVSSGGAICGKLALVDFPAATNLTPRGASYYSAPASAQEQAASGATIHQGELEGSNVSPVEGVVQLITAQRAAESMRHVLSLLDTDMNKTAVQDLARVS